MPLRVRFCCSSSPVITGICRSAMRQSGSASGSEARNCGPDRYVLVLNERVLRRRASAVNTDGSSSTIAIDDEDVFAMKVRYRYCRGFVELAKGPMHSMAYRK